MVLKGSRPGTPEVTPTDHDSAQCCHRCTLEVLLTQGVCWCNRLGDTGLAVPIFFIVMSLIEIYTLVFISRQGLPDPNALVSTAGCKQRS